MVRFPGQPGARAHHADFSVILILSLSKDEEVRQPPAMGEPCRKHRIAAKAQRFPAEDIVGGGIEVIARRIPFHSGRERGKKIAELGAGSGQRGAQRGFAGARIRRPIGPRRSGSRRGRGQGRVAGIGHGPENTTIIVSQETLFLVF